MPVSKKMKVCLAFFSACAAWWERAERGSMGWWGETAKCDKRLGIYSPTYAQQLGFTSYKGQICSRGCEVGQKIERRENGV
jgi:hypothetical protein